MILMLGILLSWCLGVLLAQSLVHFLPKMGMLDAQFYHFVISTVSFQGVALFLIFNFLRQHRLNLAEFLSPSSRGWFKAIFLGLGMGLLVLPAAIGLHMLSSFVIKEVYAEPEMQAPIRVLQLSVTLTQRIIFGVAAIAIAPLVEEILFRGILYPLIKQRGYPRLALWFTSLLFAMIHSNLGTFLPLLFLAVVFVWLYEWTDNLLAPILAHAVFNAANFCLLIYEPEVNRYWEMFRERI